MRTEEYLTILTDQIRCRMARGAVREEIRCHIEDQTAPFLSEGMEQAEAEEAAVKEMGDPDPALSVPCRFSGSAGMLSINGSASWIYLPMTGITLNLAYVQLITVPIYAAVLYRYRGQGISAVLKAVLWMIPSVLLMAWRPNIILAGAPSCTDRLIPGSSLPPASVFMRNDAVLSVFDRKIICGRRISEARSQRGSARLPG